MSEETIDEDAPINSLSSNPALQGEHDPEDEMPDFRFLSSITNKGSIPKRGDKDFEPHGTNKQQDVLELSREAMHEALSFVRVHNHSKKTGSSARGWYLGSGVEGADVIMSEEIRGKGLTSDHVVLVQAAKGPLYKAIGRAPRGINSNNVWLLPEEALYLVERGDLDLYWPNSPADLANGLYQDISKNLDETEADLPLSVQAAWALLIGAPGEVGTVQLEHYSVYSNLKRNGYAVFGASDDRVPPMEESERRPLDLFSLLFGNYFKRTPSTHGPLVSPGLYRSYTSVYRSLAIIPRHKPMPATKDLQTPQDPYAVRYVVYKTSRMAAFSKSRPGQPDFRVAIVSTRTSNHAMQQEHSAIPTLDQLTRLLESTPWDPPKHLAGDHRIYPRLKHGYRNVILAVVDQGVISFLRVGEGAFGEDSLVPRFDKAQRGGGKGGGRGRGRGRGRGGRGRGRGG